MFRPMEVDEQAFQLRPMNCPFHIQVYNARPRAYTELPLRWAELGTVYRSGERRTRGVWGKDVTRYILQGNYARILAHQMCSIPVPTSMSYRLALANSVQSVHRQQ